MAGLYDVEVVQVRRHVIPIQAKNKAEAEKIGEDTINHNPVRLRWQTSYKMSAKVVRTQEEEA